MQLNGTTMAASEPPEPPPRNPDKINASLKQLAETVSKPNWMWKIWQRMSCWKFKVEKSIDDFPMCRYIERYIASSYYSIEMNCILDSL